MAENTPIGWADHTVPFWWGCYMVSAACKYCYADTLASRFGNDIWGKDKPRKKIQAAVETLLKLNEKAKKAGRIDKVFVNSMSDFFKEDTGQVIIDHTGQVIDTSLTEMRREAFEAMDQCGNLIFLLLTKRPENIRRFWWPHFNPSTDEQSETNMPNRSNVWLGTTVENQEQADKRIPELPKCRDLASNLFLSCEALLGPVDLRAVFVGQGTSEMGGTYHHVYRPLAGYRQAVDCDTQEDTGAIDWVIAGGESGPNARPSHPDWFRSLRDQCEAAGVPFFFKQWGEWAPYKDTDKHEFGATEKPVLRLSSDSTIGDDRHSRLTRALKSMTKSQAHQPEEL